MTTVTLAHVPRVNKRRIMRERENETEGERERERERANMSNALGRD